MIQNQCVECDDWFVETKSHHGCLCPKCFEKQERELAKQESEPVPETPPRFYRVK